MSTAFLLVVDALALYLSTLVGPSPTGSPGGLVTGVSQVYTFHVESKNSTVSNGFLSADVSYSSPCTLSQNSLEAPLSNGGSESADIYTMCTAPYGSQTKTSILAKTSLLGSQTYTPLGYTNLFENSTVSCLATDNGTNFYMLSRKEGGNSSLWYATAGRDMVSISDTQEDGWQLQYLSLVGGQLFAIGNQLGNPLRSILFWGRIPPISKQPPQRYLTNSPTVQTFTFSDPNTLWTVNGPSAAGGAGQLMLYIYNKQTMSWTIGGYYMFNASFPTPTAVFLGARPSVVTFHGVAATHLMEFTIPVPTTGGTSSSTLITRTLAVPERGKQFRGLVGSNWILPSPTPYATWSSTATASSIRTSTSSFTTTPTVPSTTTASAIPIAFTASTSSTPTATPTLSSVSSSTTPSTTPTPTTTPTLPSVSSSTTPSTTPTPTTTRSVGTSASITPTATFTPTMSPTPSYSPTPTATPPSTLSPSGTPTPTNSSASSQPIPAGNNAIETLTVGEKVGLGFGITALLALLAGCVGVYICWKSGKLWTIWLKGHRADRSNYTYARSNSVRRTLQPSHIVQMSENPAHIQKLNETRVAMRIAEEQQKTIVETTGQTTTIIRRTFAPVQIPVGSFRVVRATTSGSSV